MANRVTSRRAECKNLRPFQRVSSGLVALSLLAAALSACASKRPQAVVESARVPASSLQAAAIPSAIAQPPQPQIPAIPRIRPAQPTPPKPAPAGQPIDEVAAKLSNSFIVARTSPDSLSIRRRSGVGNSRPALFEQAIILNQVRAALKSESRAAASSTATFQRGTATVAFGPQVQSGPAAVAIAKALAIPGVNQVDASFARRPAPQPRF